MQVMKDVVNVIIRLDRVIQGESSISAMNPFVLLRARSGNAAISTFVWRGNCRGDRPVAPTRNRTAGNVVALSGGYC